MQVAEGLAFLHEQGIVHGDVKAANVLVSDSKEAFICDFGLSKAEAADTSIGLEGLGSTRWMSIELLENGGGKTFASGLRHTRSVTPLSSRTNVVSTTIWRACANRVSVCPLR